MTTSYLAAHIIIRATGWEKHGIRGTIETENAEDPSTDKVSQTALNKRREIRENSTIMYLDLYTYVWL